ncbi:glycosyltransferase family 4 protein [Paraglaciecola polaris]|uniref:glycosyltransferase family 4 protein n=1 Tax=Paraglaciecola polaris TaxID=222814 RepID=UPI0030ECB436|tara:strand:- start:2700 stop:3926 length:1227 start_codon:yes stop_codon:yes gene_type:complete
MKILYLHQYFATPDSNAGTRSYEMAKRFVANGHDVTLVTSSAFLSTNYQFEPGWNYLEIDAIKLHVLHQSYSNKNSFLKRILKFIHFSWASTLKSLQLKSDVLLATSTPLTIAIPGLIYSKIKKTPFVFEVRDLWPELPIAVGAIKNPILIRFAKWLERYTYRNSKRIIGLSPGMCDGIIKHGIKSDHVTLATNGCDTALFAVESRVGESYKEDCLKFLKGRKLVVYTGTFGLINDVGYLPELARAMLSVSDEICFVAIGDGMEKNLVIEKARTFNVLDKNLYFLEPVPKTEIVKLLSAADLSLSLFGPVKEMWHNSANKLFDALASGTPIAINYGGWQETLIKKHKCGLVLDSDKHNESAKKLAEFLLDKDVYSKAVCQCNLLAYGEYSRDSIATRVERTLFEAVND